MTNDIERIDQYKRFAIMGGTFDPIHNGHLVTAEAVRDEFDLECVIFIPSGKPPHKDNSSVTHSWHRYLMTVIATVANPFFRVSRLEIERPGHTYTIDTLTHLKSICRSDAEIYFISGADAIAQIFTWKDSEKLLTMCNFVAVSRPGQDKDKLMSDIALIQKSYAGKIYFLDVPALAISSSDIRNRVGKNKPIKYLLPEEVERYIEKQELYRSAGNPEDIIDALRKNLSKKRFEHTIRVAKEAVRLSAHYRVDKEQAYIAALLHDYAKDIPYEKQIKLCEEHGITADRLLKSQPELIHAFLGAELARKRFNIPQSIYNAIKFHTTGRADMGILEKIIFLADAMDPYRKDAEQLRKTAMEDIDKAMAEKLKNKAEHVKNQGKTVHPHAIAAYKYFQDLLSNAE